MRTFTEAEHEYLADQRLGRIATIGPDGEPQVRPVGFFIDREHGTVDIGGHDLISSQKWRNLRSEPRVAFVVDDLASVDPWRPRGVEVRGRAELLTDVDPPAAGFDSARIRIHPDRVISWGIRDIDNFSLQSRDT